MTWLNFLSNPKPPDPRRNKIEVLCDHCGSTTLKDVIKVSEAPVVQPEPGHDWYLDSEMEKKVLTGFFIQRRKSHKRDLMETAFWDLGKD